jgi:hypothetical protein
MLQNGKFRRNRVAVKAKRAGGAASRADLWTDVRFERRRFPPQRLLPRVRKPVEAEPESNNSNFLI